MDANESRLMYSCKICYGTPYFMNKESYDKHNRYCHSNETPFFCQYCMRKENKPSRLVRHLHVHDDKKKIFFCNVCKKKYRLAKKLQEHMQLHAQQYPFSCDVCDQRFSLAELLAKHWWIHKKLEVDGVVCMACDHLYSDISGWLKHIEMVHVQRETNLCTVCEDSFSQPSELKDHLQMHRSNDSTLITYVLKPFRLSSS